MNTQNDQTKPSPQPTGSPVRSWSEAAAIARYLKGEDYAQRLPSYEGLGARRPA